MWICFRRAGKEFQEFQRYCPLHRSLITLLRQHMKHISDNIKISVVMCFYMKHTPDLSMQSHDQRESE